MRSAENKYLKTISRVFGPAVEKAMPVMLKVACGSIGVLFVTALLLIYSDKRFGDGWGHAEAMAFMFQRAAVILMWLVLLALVVTVIWFAGIRFSLEIKNASQVCCLAASLGGLFYHFRCLTGKHLKYGMMNGC